MLIYLSNILFQFEKHNSGNKIHASMIHGTCATSMLTALCQVAKSQVLKTPWPHHVFKAAAPMSSKRQALKAFRQIHTWSLRHFSPEHNQKSA